MHFNDRDLFGLSTTVEAVERAAITLPEAVTKLVAGIDSIEADRRAEPPMDPLAVEEDLVAATVESAVAGASVPSLDGLDQARRAQAMHADRIRLLDQAHDRLGRRLRATLAQSAEDVIVQQLRPAFDDVLTEAAEVATRCPATTATEAVHAPDKVRRAFLHLSELAGHLSALRGAHEALRSFLPPVEKDTTGLFAMYEAGLPKLWPAYRSRKNPPWPTEPMAHLRWVTLHRDEARPWLPLPAEQDAAWEREFGDQEKSRQVHALAARAYAGAPV